MDYSIITLIAISMCLTSCIPERTVILIDKDGTMQDTVKVDSYHPYLSKSASGDTLCLMKTSLVDWEATEDCPYKKDTIVTYYTNDSTWFAIQYGVGIVL